MEVTTVLLQVAATTVGVPTTLVQEETGVTQVDYLREQLLASSLQLSLSL